MLGVGCDLVWYGIDIVAALESFAGTGSRCATDVNCHLGRERNGVMRSPVVLPAGRDIDDLSFHFPVNSRSHGLTAVCGLQSWSKPTGCAEQPDILTLL